jgi:DNA-directed RNA polymerase subunit alpha
MNQFEEFKLKFKEIVDVFETYVERQEKVVNKLEYITCELHNIKDRILEILDDKDLFELAQMRLKKKSKAIQVDLNLDDEDDEYDFPFNPILLKKVLDLHLSGRSRNCLRDANIVYIGDLIHMSELDMFKRKNVGRKSINEIKNALSEYNLKFGMEIPSWPPENLEELVKKYTYPMGNLDRLSRKNWGI